MTVIDISRTADEIHDAMVRELRASGAFGVNGASGGIRMLGPETINRESVMRVAYLLSQGVGVESNGGPFRVIGAAPQAVSGAWDGKPLPKSAQLNGDLTGHVEIYRNGSKVCYRRCLHCADSFTTTRPASEVYRWPSYCKPECRKAELAKRRREKRKRAA